MSDKAIFELISLGIKLPYPPEVIARLEETGCIVDLHTGEIIIGGADQRIALTVIGDAVATVLGCDDSQEGVDD